MASQPLRILTPQGGWHEAAGARAFARILAREAARALTSASSDAAADVPASSGAAGSTRQKRHGHR